PKGLVRCAWDAIPLVETSIVRQSSVDAPQVPLAEVAGAVAGAGKQFGDGHFPLRESVKPTAGRDRMCAGTDGKAPSHDSRPARGTLRLDVEVEQSRALARELVDAGSWRAAEHAAPVRAHLAVPEIVHQDEDDVGLRCLLTKGQRGVNTTGRCQPAEQGAGGEEGRSGQRCARSHVIVLRKGARRGEGPLPGPRKE